MVDPFVAALDAQFHAPGSAAAFYTPFDDAPLVDPIRVIRAQPDVESPFGDERTVHSTNIFLIRRSEVEQPLRNDQLDLDGAVFLLNGEPMLDVEGMTWTCGAMPLPA